MVKVRETVIPGGSFYHNICLFVCLFVCCLFICFCLFFVCLFVFANNFMLPVKHFWVNLNQAGGVYRTVNTQQSWFVLLARGTMNRCIPSSSWPSLASKYLVLPHFFLCLKVLCLLVLHWIVLSHLLFYWFGLLPLRPHIVWDFPVWSFFILSSLVFVLYHMVL